jgi:hypothetical protein
LQGSNNYPFPSQDKENIIIDQITMSKLVDKNSISSHVPSEHEETKLDQVSKNSEKESEFILEFDSDDLPILPNDTQMVQDLQRMKLLDHPISKDRSILLVSFLGWIHRRGRILKFGDNKYELVLKLLYPQVEQPLIIQALRTLKFKGTANTIRVQPPGKTLPGEEAFTELFMGHSFPYFMHLMGTSIGNKLGTTKPFLPEWLLSPKTSLSLKSYFLNAFVMGTLAYESNLKLTETKLKIAMNPDEYQVPASFLEKLDVYFQGIQQLFQEVTSNKAISVPELTLEEKQKNAQKELEKLNIKKERQEERHQMSVDNILKNGLLQLEMSRRQRRSTNPDTCNTIPHPFWESQPVTGLKIPVYSSGYIKQSFGKVAETPKAFKKDPNTGESVYQWLDEIPKDEFLQQYAQEFERHNQHYPLSTLMAWMTGYNCYQVGVKRTSNGKLVGCLLAREITFYHNKDTIPMLETGWLYVAPAYRKKNPNMVKFLVEELRRKVIIENTRREGTEQPTVLASTFSPDFIVPSPTITFTQSIRELHPEYLQHFIPLTKDDDNDKRVSEAGGEIMKVGNKAKPVESLEEKIRMLELSSELKVSGLRRAVEDDIPVIAEFLNTEVNCFTFWRRWEESQLLGLLQHGLLWIVLNKEGELTDVVGMVEQIWKVHSPYNKGMNKDSTIRVLKIVLQAFTADSEYTITQIMSDLLSIARKQMNYHIMVADQIGETEMYSKNLWFSDWGHPQYLNFYNYRCLTQLPGQLGYSPNW